MIKQDNLNIDNFIAADGQNYRQATELDLAELTKFFQGLGYQVIKLDQLWRHVTGVLQKGNAKYFLKLATTAGIAERTKNEATWNLAMEKKLANQPSSFIVPKIYDQGTYQDKFYYLSSYHAGEKLAEKNDSKRLGTWINKIVDCNRYLIALDDLDLYRDKQIQDEAKCWQDFSDKLKGWCDEVKDQDLEWVLYTALGLNFDFKPATNHGDFTPWHMIAEGDKFVLIDGEHASARTAKYYDVAYFYHRLYTSAKRPDMANVYLDLFKYNADSDFDQQFYPALASRIIGGFWDAKNSGDDFKFHQAIKRQLFVSTLGVI